MSNQTTVSDLFRRAMEIRQSNPNGTFKDVKEKLVSEFDGKPFPSPAFLTIPEYDNIAPQEDWTAGLRRSFCAAFKPKVGQKSRKVSSSVWSKSKITRRNRAGKMRPKKNGAIVIKASPKKKRKI